MSNSCYKLTCEHGSTVSLLWTCCSGQTCCLQTADSHWSSTLPLCVCVCECVFECKWAMWQQWIQPVPVMAQWGCVVFTEQTSHTSCFCSSDHISTWFKEKKKRKKKFTHLRGKHWMIGLIINAPFNWWLYIKSSRCGRQLVKMLAWRTTHTCVILVTIFSSVKEGSQILVFLFNSSIARWDQPEEVGFKAWAPPLYDVGLACEAAAAKRKAFKYSIFCSKCDVSG